MAREYVDRGDIVSGLNTLARDTRVPINIPRNIENFSIRSGRLRRRDGYTPYGEAFRQTVLCKHSINTKQAEESSRLLQVRSEHLTTPLSYALIPWHDDFQPRSDRFWTFSFMAQLNSMELLALTGRLRLSRNTYGINSENTRLRAAKGVFLYDQSLLSNHHNFNLVTDLNIGTNEDISIVPGTTDRDVFALSALDISYTLGGLVVHFTTYDTATAVYYDYPGTTLNWNPGAAEDPFHLSVTYDSITRLLSLYINNALIEVVGLPAGHVFAGERDTINGIGTIGYKRDIVLLNECTVRASYCSTCKIRAESAPEVVGDGHQNFIPSAADLTDAQNLPFPWAMSPGQGTCLWDLKWFNAVVPPDTLYPTLPAYSRMTQEEVDEDTQLVGYWPLQDGGPIGFDLKNRRNATLHSTYPSIINAPGSTTGAGILIRDNQFIAHAYAYGDPNFIDDSRKAMQDVFETRDTYALDLNPGDTLTHNFYTKHEFTIELSFRMPYSTQDELNQVVGASQLGPGQTGYMTRTGNDLRLGMDINAYAMTDAYGNLVRRELGQDPVDDGPKEWYRAYDQTILSIEGTELIRGSNIGVSNDYLKRRYPATRVMVTPTGHIAFENWVWVEDPLDNLNNHTRYIRLVSANPMPLGSLVALTCLKRILYKADGSNGSIPYGISFEMYNSGIQVPLASVVVQDGSVPNPDSISIPDLTSLSHVHEVLDINIGSSFINDSFDRSIARPQSPNPSGNIEEWPLSQRWKSPYQDQPGIFTFHHFRFWSYAFNVSELPVRAIGDVDKSFEHHNLVFNIRAADAAGPFIKNRAKYPIFFKSDYKGWGTPGGNDMFDTRFTPFKSGYSYEDCLGYMDPQSFRFSRDHNLKTQGIFSAAETLAQRYGVLVAARSVLKYDAGATGSLVDVFLPTYGLLSDFLPGHNWHSTTIGDGTFIFSRGGRPRVFRAGQAYLPAFGPWHGGIPIMNMFSLEGGVVTQDKYWGIVVLYFSEENAVHHISPRQVIATKQTLDGVLQVKYVQQHPDVRITHMAIATTTPQESAELAKFGPLFHHQDITTLPNRYWDEILMFRDNDQTQAPLDFNITEFPIGATGAAYGNRLYVASLLVPDAIFPSDPGAPERFDTIANRIVLEEGSGDRIVRLVSLFGALYAFKTNSIWRIVEVSVGQWQVQKFASIGAVAIDVAQITFPDTGRVAAVFWSGSGPFIFDEVNLQYIGTPLEEETADPYQWMQPGSVVIGHHPESRELLFSYKTTHSKIYDEMVVYNYANNSWRRDTGVSFATIQSMNLATERFRPDGAIDAPAVTAFDSDFLFTLCGDEQGNFFKWASGNRDGNTELDIPRTIVEYDSETGLIQYELPTDDPQVQSDSFNNTETNKGLWATIYQADLEVWMMYPVKTTDVDNARITIDLSYRSTVFEPRAGDIVLVGLPPARVEFPWDQLDVPFFDKQIYEFILWFKGKMYWRYARNWDSTKYTKTQYKDSKDQRRHKLPVNQVLESIKMELINLDGACQVDGFAYFVERMTRGIVQ